METSLPLASAVGGVGAEPALTVALAVVVAGLFGTRLESRAQRNWRRVVGGSLVVLAVVVALVFLLLPEGTRSLGLFAVLSAAPSSALFAFGFITQFGDPWFLVLIATAVYLLGSSRELVETPREGAFVLAVTFGALATVDLLKHLFSLPRPTGAAEATPPSWIPVALDGLFYELTTGTGYAFPSGHALGTTVVFGALAYCLHASTARTRWVVAAAGVALITLSRLVLGVHFLVDVVAGVVAGLVFLGVAVWIASDRPIRAFGLAALVGGAAVLATALSSSPELWAAGQWFGAALGGGVVWYLVRPSHELALRGSLVAGAFVAPLWIGTYALSPTLVVTVVLTAIAAGVTVGAPSLAKWVKEKG